MSTPRSLKETAARVLLTQTDFDLAAAVLSDDLNKYIALLQGTSPEWVKNVATYVEKALNELSAEIFNTDLHSDVAEPYIVAGYAQAYVDKLKELQSTIADAYTAVTSDISIVQDQGSQQWKDYALPSLQSLQHKVCELHIFISHAINEFEPFAQQ